MQKDFVKPSAFVSFNWSVNNVEKHDHHFYEFFVVTKGEYSYSFNDHATTIKRGDFMLVRPGDTHAFIASDNSAQHINFCATTEKFRSLCDALSPTVYDELTKREHGIISLSPSQIDFFTNDAIQIHLNNPSDSIDPFELLLINEMLVAGASIAYKVSLAPQKDLPTWFKELLILIHSPESISLRAKDVYSISHYAPTTIINLFKKYTGETVISYLTKIKMTYACDALLNTDATTLSIASSLSYDSLSAFNHVFKSYTGMSPIEYKKKHKLPPPENIEE